MNYKITQHKTFFLFERLKFDNFMNINEGMICTAEKETVSANYNLNEDKQYETVKNSSSNK